MAESRSENVSVAEIPSLDWNRALVLPMGAEPGAPLEPDERYPADVAVLTFDSVAEAENAALRIEALDPARYLRGPVRVASPVQTLRQYRETRRTFDRLIALVAILTAISAVVGVSNILSASVIARTREIGLRRAVGARSADIVGQFRAEGLLVGALGGGAGLAAGALASALLSRSSGSGGGLSGLTLFALAGGCLVIGILTGLRPSQRAAQIDPAAALREG
jgi:putative ABC transport system permease protein